MGKYQNQKLTAVKKLSDNITKQISGSRGDWKTFLSFYTKFYKYTFSEAALIYAQRPQATACASFELWNKRNRRIHRGSTGIAILFEAEKNVEIRYVFDVADTYGDEHGLPHRWKLENRHLPELNTLLKEKWTFHEAYADIDEELNLRTLVMEYCIANAKSFMEEFDQEGLLLENVDPQNTRQKFLETLIDSVGYLVCERCGIEKGMYEDEETAFSYLYEFNTQPILSILGTAVLHYENTKWGNINYNRLWGHTDSLTDNENRTCERQQNVMAYYKGT